MIRRTEIELGRLEPPTGSASPWHTQARELWTSATGAFERRDDEKAWELVLDARRSLVPLLSDEEKGALAVSLRAQTRKVDGWRKESLVELLPHPGKDVRPTDAYLMEAMLHLDVADANKIRVEQSRKDELRAAAAFLLVALVLTPVIVIVGPDLDLADVDFANVKLVLLVQIFGILGACISAIERTTKRARRRVPDERAARLATSVRLVTGAAGGLLALAAGQADILGTQEGAVLLAAFAAGLSERFVLGLVPATPAGREGGAGEAP